MEITCDFFFSYRRQDLERARPLLEALAHAGVRVWLDKQDIPDQGSITAEIRKGIANARALIAFYSSIYPLSNPCQQEITAAWLAAQHIHPDAGQRVWIVNPEATFEFTEAAAKPANSARNGERPAVCRNCRGSEGASGRARFLHVAWAWVSGPAPISGYEPDSSRLFVGRTTELWDLHGQLTANQLSIITGRYGQATAQVRGLGGNGKSLLAREYSIRFGPAYPGGVFWLNAYGHDDSKYSLQTEQREAQRQSQIREFALRSGVPVEGLDASQIETRFWLEIDRRGERCLWIVDDLPSGLEASELERLWIARCAKASTLMTTRSKEYGARGEALDLGVLSSWEALALLCSHRQPTSAAEESAAHRIVEFLGNHPLAVEVAGRYLAEGFEGFESYAEALANQANDAIEFGKVLKESLPTGHERSISATLLKSIRQLAPEGLDFLRLASVLAVASIPVSFVSEVFCALIGVNYISLRIASIRNVTEGLIVVGI